MKDLEAVYTAVDEQSALLALDDFGAKWDKKYYIFNIGTKALGSLAPM